jgi:hypothetical protein
MRCERCIDLYIESDNREELPFGARLHVSHCGLCRAEIERLESARLGLLSLLPEPAGECSIRIMAAVHLAKRPRREVGFREWIVSFLVLLLSMLLAPLGSDFHWIKALFGTDFLIPFSLFFGVALTIYCALFIASHMDFLSERFGIEK